MSERADILIVEDEPVVVTAARRILEGTGLSVATAEDGDQGLALVAKGPYRAVLCDLMLPGTTGLKVLEGARSATPPSLVIMITGYATLENALESFRLGAFDFIPKPFDSEELLAVVGRALRYPASLPHLRGPIPAGGGDPGRHRLGDHCWARVQPDGSASVGVGASLAGLLGEIDEIDLPIPGDRVSQGRALCRIRATDGLVHRVWAPLSGRIIAANGSLISDPSLLDRDPYEAGWLVELIPTSLDEELGGLSQSESVPGPPVPVGGAEAPEE